MKPITYGDLLDFENTVGDFASECEVKTKEDLEWFSELLHNHLETAIEYYAADLGIEDYEQQY